MAWIGVQTHIWAGHKVLLLPPIPIQRDNLSEYFQQPRSHRWRKRALSRLLTERRALKALQPSLRDRMSCEPR